MDNPQHVELLREQVSTLSQINRRLSTMVGDLERCRKTHEALTGVAASGAGEPGIAAEVYRLTGLSVAVEDRFGHLRVWAGPNEPAPYPRLPIHKWEALVTHAQRSNRPIRDRDRLISLARSRAEILGVLALVDPEHRAGEHEVFALEHGAVVLAMELAHSQKLAETELRLRHGLMEDLLSGTDEAGACSRAAALGHDLQGPHQVVVMQWQSPVADETVARAAVRTSRRFLDTGVLLTRQTGRVVLLIPWSGWRTPSPRWGDLHRALSKELRSSKGAIAIGRRCDSPSQIPRSYRE
ncbi:MAG: PucR family transcriptional regulator, partial [Terriglobales bacterium]